MKIHTDSEKIELLRCEREEGKPWNIKYETSFQKQQILGIKISIVDTLEIKMEFIIINKDSPESDIIKIGEIVLISENSKEFQELVNVGMIQQNTGEIGKGRYGTQIILSRWQE